MKLRTISDSVRHSTSATHFRWSAYTGIGEQYEDFKVTIFYPLLSITYRDFTKYFRAQTGRSSPQLIRMGARRNVGRRNMTLQVPVLASLLRAGSAPWAMARFTADRMASKEAVMILPCIPAPKSVRRERVVISI
jgi:hypothetical protein